MRGGPGDFGEVVVVVEPAVPVLGHARRLIGPGMAVAKGLECGGYV